MWPEHQRFLVLTPALDGADGISELSRQVVTTLQTAAGADRVEVWALAGEAAEAGKAGRAAGFRTARGSRARIVAWTLARAAHRQDEVTIVVLHVHLAPLARVLARRGARVVLFLIGVEVWRRLRSRERHAVESAQGLIAISRATARRFREANPDLAAVPVSVCLLGIKRRAARTSDADNASGVRPGFALIVGRLSSEERYKGHDQLLAVWPAVRRQVPDARLVIVGDGDDRARLEALAASAGLSDAVRFAGRVGDSALASLYARSAFFVMPSSREGFGLVYLEAMQAGKACIAAHGAADEIIDDGVQGLVIDPDAPDQLTAALVRLFSDAGACARMGAAACARVAADFTDASFAARLLSTLEAIAQAAPAPESVPAAGEMTSR